MFVHMYVPYVLVLVLIMLKSLPALILRVFASFVNSKLFTKLLSEKTWTVYLLLQYCYIRLKEGQMQTSSYHCYSLNKPFPGTLHIGHTKIIPMVPHSEAREQATMRIIQRIVIVASIVHISAKSSFSNPSPMHHHKFSLLVLTDLQQIQTTCRG